MNKSIYILLLFTIALAGCSATTTDVDSSISKQGVDSKTEMLAQEHFIRGAIHDLKGEYHAAILEYKDALKLDEQAGIHNVLSKDYLIVQQVAAALKHSQRAVELSPNDVEYNFLLGSIYKIAQRPDSAEIYFEKVIQLDSLYYQAYYSLAQLNQAEKPLKSLEIYNKLLRLTGPEWSVLVKIAELNERMGNVDRTINTVEELLKLNPSNLRLQKLLIESYLKTDRNDEALALVDDALAMFPYDLTLIEYKGNVKANQNKWDEAAIEYLKLISSNELPFEVKKRIAGGFVTEAAKDSTIIPIAKNLLSEIEKDSSDWQTNTFLGEISLVENNDSVAIIYFKKATALAPWNAQLWNRLGILLFESNRYEEAVVEMKNAVTKFPDDFVDNLILGLSLSQQKDIEGAGRALEHAVRLNPNDLTALHAYGFTLNQLNRNDAALVYLEKALSLSPDNTQVIGTMGMIYDSMGNYEMSDSLYERALLVDSTNVLISNNYAYSLSERGEKLDRALKLSEYAVEQEPKNSSYLDTIGWVYFKLKNFNKAIEYIEKAIKEDEANATLFDHLADIYAEMNNKDKAIEYWNKALELDPNMGSVVEKIEKMDEG
jgi:tetratricopeptide (TPR) repeat protein